MNKKNTKNQVPETFRVVDGLNLLESRSMKFQRLVEGYSTIRYNEQQKVHVPQKSTIRKMSYKAFKESLQKLDNIVDTEGWTQEAITLDDELFNEAMNNKKATKVIFENDDIKVVISKQLMAFFDSEGCDGLFVPDIEGKDLIILTKNDKAILLHELCHYLYHIKDDEYLNINQMIPKDIVSGYMDDLKHYPGCDNMMVRYDEAMAFIHQDEMENGFDSPVYELPLVKEIVFNE